MTITFDRSPAAPPVGTRKHVHVSAHRLLDAVLFLTILISPLVFIEPAPYEALVAILAIVAVLARVTLDRKLLPLIALLLVWNAGGAFSLMPVVEDPIAVWYLVTSFYLSMTAPIFACVFLHDTEHRMRILRVAYILAAVATSAAGIIGYFHLLPGTEMFTRYTRAMGTFKDPNVFGPFLVLPLLFLVETTMIRRMRLRHLVGGAIILLGLLLSFSRAAWGHFVFSTIIMLALLFVTAHGNRLRARIVAFALTATAAVGVLVLGIMSIGTVRTMFEQRAALTQEYDVGESGRFGRQLEGVLLLLDRPNGLGPNQFDRHFLAAPHETYLNGFSSYGWIGGATWIAIVLLTLAVGFRYVLIPTPWQPYLIAVVAAYVGEAFIGFVIDTDHWRHYHLIMGLVWGLAIATANARRRMLESGWVGA